MTLGVKVWRFDGYEGFAPSALTFLVLSIQALFRALRVSMPLGFGSCC